MLESILAALGMPDSLGHSVGIEYNVQAGYKLTDKLSVNASGTNFKADQEVRKVYGDNDLSINALVGIQFNF